MKKLLLISLLYSTATFAISFECEKKQYREIYANILMDSFDHELDMAVNTVDQFELFENENYQKLLAIRTLLEESHGDCHSTSKHTDLIFIRNVKMFEKIVDEVEVRAKEIEVELPKKRNSEPLIFPSNTSSGNVTGNSFPKNTWAITFDDGPNPITTPTVLANLKNHDFQATFFVLTEKALKNLDIIESIRDTQELALHSYTHANLSKSTADLDKEIHLAKDDLERETNFEIKYFRLPYGAGVNLSRVRTEVTKANLIHLFWNIDTLDWNDKNPDSIVARSLKLMKATPNFSGVILFHDIHKQSVIASEKLMKYLKDNKQTVCTVGQIIEGINQGLEGCLK
jgi:peptidoglycan/xylan/chitin deacetylase (PgdA/CDA1 family)